MSGLIDSLSTLSTIAIVIAAAIHLAVFFMLWAWSRRDLRTIASSLDDFTRGLRHRSILDSTGHLSDQVEAFIADVNDVLDDPGRTADRQTLLQRMSILDEKRRYLHSLAFETVYNVCRTMVEAYPLFGILGTILAIGASLRAHRAVSAGTSAAGEIVERFSESIWCTFAGLCAMIVLMMLNSALEPRFMRLSENRAHVREMIARVKRELSFAPAEASR
jgi:biopolymer transport protein ExbB